jgi:hypothetical protein
MKARVEAGTDIARIGAWDASRNDTVVAKRWGKEWDRMLEEDAARGDLFLIDTGADGGGPIDVYCDTEVPPEARAHTRLVAGEFLVCVPTGRLMVGGLEDYRSDEATSRRSRVTTASCIFREATICCDALLTRRAKRRAVRVGPIHRN